MSPIASAPTAAADRRHGSGIGSSNRQELPTSSSSPYPSKLQGLEHQPSHPRGCRKQPDTCTAELCSRGKTGAAEAALEKPLFLPT